MWFHLEDVGPDTPRLPEHRWAALGQLAASIVVHSAAALTIAFAFTLSVPSTPTVAPARAAREPLRVDMHHLVFLAPDPRGPGSGGGGGGNRQAAPIRRAQGIGSDAITLPVRKAPPTRVPDMTSPAAEKDVPTLPSVVLDVKPLASGAFDHIGLPTSGVLSSESTGSGSGGGVGTGLGTGIGPGIGPGMGPGSGGGMGGGVFRPGGAVSAPKVIAQAKPKYTNQALFHKVQGTVVLELVVTSEGRPAHVHVIRSLGQGLDEEAVAALMQWRFEPGRLAGTPVDVRVTVMLDFRIQ